MFTFWNLWKNDFNLHAKSESSWSRRKRLQWSRKFCPWWRINRCEWVLEKYHIWCKQRLRFPFRVMGRSSRLGTVWATYKPFRVCFPSWCISSTSLSGVLSLLRFPRYYRWKWNRDVFARIYWHHQTRSHILWTTAHFIISYTVLAIFARLSCVVVTLRSWIQAPIYLLMEDRRGSVGILTPLRSGLWQMHGIWIASFVDDKSSTTSARIYKDEMQHELPL